MPLPVIAAVDGSAESLAAAEWAARETVRRKRSLLLVHAWSRHPRQDGEPATPAQRLVALRALRQAGERIGRACPEIRFEEEQVEGPATAALLRAAEQADVLVLGSRGLSGFTGFLVGSVALGVVARAGRPVVLVRADGETAGAYMPALPEPGGGRDVVLGLDLADPCDEVIEFALEAAPCGEGRLRAVHAWQSPAPFPLGPGEIALIERPRRADEWRGFMARRPGTLAREVPRRRGRRDPHRGPGRRSPDPRGLRGGPARRGPPDHSGPGARSHRPRRTRSHPPRRLPRGRRAA